MLVQISKCIQTKKFVPTLNLVQTQRVYKLKEFTNSKSVPIQKPIPSSKLAPTSKIVPNWKLLPTSKCVLTSKLEPLLLLKLLIDITTSITLYQRRCDDKFPPGICLHWPLQRKSIPFKDPVEGGDTTSQGRVRLLAVVTTIYCNRIALYQLLIKNHIHLTVCT